MSTFKGTVLGDGSSTGTQGTAKSGISAAARCDEGSIITRLCVDRGRVKCIIGVADGSTAFWSRILYAGPLDTLLESIVLAPVGFLSDLESGS